MWEHDIYIKYILEIFSETKDYLKTKKNIKEWGWEW
jgi:hypothetical protein